MKPGRPIGTTKPNNRESVTVRLPPEMKTRLATTNASREIEKALRLLWGDNV